MFHYFFHSSRIPTDRHVLRLFKFILLEALFCFLCENAICLLANKTKQMAHLTLLLHYHFLVWWTLKITKSKQISFQTLITQACRIIHNSYCYSFNSTSLQKECSFFWLQKERKKGRKDRSRTEGIIIISLPAQLDNKSRIKISGSDDMNLFNPI